VEEARKEGFRVPKTKQSSKGQRGRAFRGMTSSGKKMRALKKS
jgi:ribosomal protein L15E